MYSFVIVLLSLCIGLSIQQTPRCLLSREDYLLCLYQNRRLARATTNEYSVHHTRLRQSDSGFLECNVRVFQQAVSEISNLGTQDMRIIFSPGFITNVEYDNQVRAEYLVQCSGTDELAFFNVTTINMQGRDDCQDTDGNFRCQDYLQIDRGAFGTTDVCGDTPSPDAVVQLEFGDFTAVFRTSEEVRGVGFQMYTVCFKQAETNLIGCFEVTEFTTGVCSSETTAPPDTTTAPTSGGTTTPQTKRDAEDFEVDYDVGDDNGGMTVGYSELFPGYPGHLKMPRDLANFHHQWNRKKRDLGKDKELAIVNVAYNQTVFYSDSTIFVFGPDSSTIPIEKYEGVLVLQTFNIRGEVDYYLNEFNGTRIPHFTGPGPLIIVDRNAYFQLFVIDPREILPNEEEQVELVTMTTPLLGRVPEEDDIISIDPDQTPADLSQFSGIIGKRQTTTTAPLTDMDGEAVLSALRNMEACNPVLRAQSRATLTYYSGIDPSFVEGLRVFPISCVLGGVMLSCSTDSTTLPGRTMCQIDNQAPFMCEPFGLPPTVLPETPTTSVTVTAVNCLGQRAEQVVTDSSG